MRKEIEKIKVYLDTSIIFGYFLAKYKELRKGKQFLEPEVVKFLKEKKERFEYYVSLTTKAEVIRRFMSELGTEREESIKLWQSFLEEIGVVEIEITKPYDEIYEDVVNIVEETKIKRRVTNLEHLVIAKSYGLIFVTGDKEVLKKCKRYYQKILRIDLNLKQTITNYANPNRREENSKKDSSKARILEKAQPGEIQRSDESYKNGSGKNSLGFIPFIPLLSFLNFSALALAKVQIWPIDINHGGFSVKV